MKINIPVRLKNPVFLAQILMSVLVPILAYAGLTLQDITTWSALGDLLVSAIRNPYVLVLVVGSVFNALTDPTTAGIGDTNRAMGYSTPYKDKE